jgi:hypothetical protein
VAELVLKENNAALWNRVQELETNANGLRRDPDAATLDLAVELQRVYDSEINMRIGWCHAAASRDGPSAVPNVEKTDRRCPKH